MRRLVVFLALAGCGFDPHPTYQTTPDGGADAEPALVDTARADLAPFADTAGPDAAPAPDLRVADVQPDTTGAKLDARADLVADLPPAPDVARDLQPPPDMREGGQLEADQPKPILGISGSTVLGRAAAGTVGQSFEYRVQNMGTAPTGQLVVALDNDVVAVVTDNCSASLPPGEACAVVLALAPRPLATPGNVTVTLKVTGAAGCSDSITATGEVMPAVAPEPGSDGGAGDGSSDVAPDATADVFDAVSTVDSRDGSTLTCAQLCRIEVSGCGAPLFRVLCPDLPGAYCCCPCQDP